MELTELIQYLGKHQGDGAAYGLFSIREHSMDGGMERFQLSFDFHEQSRQISSLVLLSKGAPAGSDCERQAHHDIRTSCPTSGCKSSRARIRRSCFGNRTLMRS